MQTSCCTRRRPAIQPSRDIAARYSPNDVAGLRRPYHRLARCASCAARAWRFPSGRLRRVRSGIYRFLGPDVHVVAVCQSTVPVLSKPLDRFARTLINTVPRPHAGAGRKVYPGFRQHTAFVSMNPDRHLKAHVDYFHDVSAGDTEAANKHPTFYDEYNAVLDMAAEYYLETVASCFRTSRSRAERGWSMASECVPKRFATPY